MAKLNPTLFREYDIRGKENEHELHPDSVYRIARAYGTFLRKRGMERAVLGHDNRKTSEAFYGLARKALVESGVETIGIGMCLTPMSYFAQYPLKAEGLCMITASHNPAGWNGMKLGCGYSKTLLTPEIQELRSIAEENAFIDGHGTFRAEDMFTRYAQDLLSRVTLQRKLKVLINTANATSGFFSPKLLRDFGCDVIEHNTDPDPSYPNYVPNPANVEMMQDTGRQVVKHGADIGIAIDADGDRLGICDEKGETIWPDRWLILLAQSVLARAPGSKIVFDVKVSEALPEAIRAAGGVPIMWKTGHSYIKQKMQEEKAALAGELSGHVFFGGDFYGFDDANFAALKLLEYLSAKEETVSDIIRGTPYYLSTPAYHAHADDEKKYAIVDALTEEFKKDGYRVIDINGARVYLENGWGLVRASSNLPALVIRFEAKTEDGLRNIEKIFREKLKRFPEVATEWESA